MSSIALKEKRKEHERDEKERAYLSKLGIKDVSRLATSDAYVVFDRKGTFIRTVYVSQEFPDGLPGFEKWLKKSKLYGHRVSSFYSRPSEWYDWPFVAQLKNLAWDFDDKGVLKNTEW